MSEEMVVCLCAPTLAGMKTGSLISGLFTGSDDLRVYLRRLNRRLGKKGIRVIPLRFCKGQALLYMYRPHQLLRDLQDPDARQLLQDCGYSVDSVSRCVAQLRQRLRTAAEFPHEIGLFLGYPPEDVCGFIENKARGSKLTGYWKVYGDVDAAQKRFARYRRCTENYCARWQGGAAIERLAVTLPVQRSM